jgi:uncharacterized membrane protein
MTRWLLGYGVAGGTFLLVDLVWLGVVAPAVYRPQIAQIMIDRVRVAPAALFYAIYIGGILFFAVQPALKAQSALVAASTGALLGLLAYSTYDLTNLATIKVWTVKAAALDMAWGTILTSASASAAYLAMAV